MAVKTPYEREKGGRVGMAVKTLRWLWACLPI